MTPLTIGVVLVLLGALGIALGSYLYFRRLYASPWLLLLGPADAGKSTLVASALESASERKRWFDVAWHVVARQRGLDLSRMINGVVVDVDGSVAFPAEGADLTPWHRVLRVLARSRPRRPIDGVMLVVPAQRLLTDPVGVQDLGAGIRDRLTELQTRFGFVLPVYVVIAQCDQLRGFRAFASAMPGRGQDMLGWSNDRTASSIEGALAGDQQALEALAFKGEWIADGFAGLQQSIVQASVDAFGSNDPVEDPADVLLFSGEVGRLAIPLRALLEEAFRPSLYRESCFLRGFYLCGDGTPPAPANAGDLDAASLRPASVERVNFVDHLLDRKVFPERGLAMPLPEVAVARLRRRLAAQVVCALLAVGLAAGTTWSYLRLRDAQGAYAQVLTMARQMRRDAQAPTDQTMRPRLVESRSFLERLQEIRPGRFAELAMMTFMPASIPSERAVSREASRAFNQVVLKDIHDGLSLKGRRWLESADVQSGDRQGPLGPAIETTAPYRALDRFATEYQQFVTAYQRYDRLRRGQGASDPAAPAELLSYVSDAAPRSRPAEAGATAPPPPRMSSTLTRAVNVASANPIDCSAFEIGPASRDSLVGVQATALLREFGSRSFGDTSPLLSAAKGLEANWKGVWEATDERSDSEKLTSLVDDTARLSQAVTAWAALGTPSRALPIPVLDRAPYTRLQPPPGDPVCDALRPDLSGPIRDVETLRDELSDRLLAMTIDPFGPILEQGDKGLALAKPIAELKTGFDALQRESFWPPQPPGMSGGLPANPSWAPEAIDDVLKVAEAFTVFRGRAFGGLEHPQREELLKLVESQVAELLVTRLEVTAVPAPPSADPAMRLEEIAQLGGRLGKLERIVGLLATDELGLELLRRLDDQANGALQFIDRTASTRYPAIFVRRSNIVLSEWAGIRSTSPQTPEAIKRWGGVADELREGTRQLALAAAPIARYLAVSRPHLARRTATDLETRWNAIATDVANYDLKRPSALGVLDTTIRDGVPAMVAERDCGSFSTAEASAGFLAGVRDEIVAEGIRRCRAGVENRYAAIAAAFNELLSGRFPFSRTLEDVLEVTPDQAARFMSAFDNAGGRTLAQPLLTLGCSATASAFVQQMTSAYALMTPATAAPPGADAPASAVVLDTAPAAFRVARGRHHGGDQIAEWSMTIGRQTFSENALATAKPAPWTPGDPVSVRMRFARNSPHQPIAGALFGRVDDRSIVYEFRGTWALFGLLRSGRALAAADPSLREVAPIVLGFDIPVTRDPAHKLVDDEELASPFRVYMRMRIFQAGKTDPLIFDGFPVEAPLRASCPGT